MRLLDEQSDGRYTDAMQMQRQALEAEAHRGINALQQGDFIMARDAFAAVTTSADASPQAWLFYAQACEGCDDRDQALVALDQVLAADPGNSFAWLMKGDIFGRSGDDRASSLSIGWACAAPPNSSSCRETCPSA